MKKRSLAFLCIALVLIAVSSIFVTALATEITGVKGDLNYDGVLNRKDYFLLSTYVKSGTGNFELSVIDFNGDGLTANSATANNGSALFIDGVGKNGNLKSGYGDIKITEQDMLQLLQYLEAEKNPVIIIE